MLLCVGRILIALITLIRSTPLRSENRLHSFRNARIVARYEFSTIFVVSDSMGRSITVSGNCSVFRTSRRNFSTRVAGFGVAAGADAPEIADRRDVFAARHDALETVREQAARS